MVENMNGTQVIDQPQDMNIPERYNTVQPMAHYGFPIPFAKSLANWATFKAVMDIIVGALSCLGIITAAYGVFQIIAGVKLLGAVDNLKKQMMSNDQQDIFNALFNFNKYFKFSGISMIIKISIAILGIIFYVAIFAYVITRLPDFMRVLPNDSGYF